MCQKIADQNRQICAPRTFFSGALEPANVWISHPNSRHFEMLEISLVRWLLTQQAVMYSTVPCNRFLYVHDWPGEAWLTWQGIMPMEIHSLCGFPPWSLKFKIGISWYNNPFLQDQTQAKSLLHNLMGIHEWGRAPRATCSWPARESTNIKNSGYNGSKTAVKWENMNLPVRVEKAKKYFSSKLVN